MKEKTPSHPIFRTGAHPGLIQIARLGTLCCKAHAHGHHWKLALRDALTRVMNHDPVYAQCHAHGSVSLGPDAALVAKLLLDSHAFELRGATTITIGAHTAGDVQQTPMGRGLMALLTGQLVHVDLLENGTLEVRANRRSWHHDDRLYVSPNHRALMSFAVTDLR